MITDARGRIIVLITEGACAGRIGAVEPQRPGDSTLRIDLGSSAVTKAPGDFKPITIGQSVALAA